MRSDLILVLVLCGLQLAEALQSLQLPKVFQMFQPKDAEVIKSDCSREDLEKELIKSISKTEYGKSATLPNQIDVLNLVSKLETEFPAPSLQDILEDGTMIDGTWYLQYTAPSEIEADEIEGAELKSSWEVKDAEENITTKRFEAKGSAQIGRAHV